MRDGSPGNALVLSLEKKASPMSMVGFPLLLIPLAIYNIIVFLMPGVSLAEPLLKLTLMSGAEWPVTLSDILLALGILMLLFEVIKGARPGAKYLTDHLLSLIVFGARRRRIRAVAAVRHLDLFPAGVAGAGGFPVRHRVARAARRAGGVSAPRSPGASARTAEPPVAEPQFEPAPAPVAGAASVAGRGLGRRIRAAGSSRAEARRSRRSVPDSAAPSCAVAGSAVAGTAAGQRLAAVAGRAAALSYRLIR